MSKFESSPVNTAFLKQILVLPHPGKKPVFIVGVSGGPDSMALLYLMHRHGYEVVVVHCNYGLRGEQSEKDQKLVEEVCMLWNMECVSVKLDHNSSENGNFQQWARNERYRIFRDLKEEYQGKYILTAHHQDDQIETILQKILRGSGISALKGIESVKMDLFRPLLEVSKSQILDFVEEFNIPYRIDASNEESTYARNFLRNRWFPMLESLFPGWRSNILSLREKAAVHQDLIEFVAGEVRNDKLSFKRSRFNNLQDTLKPVVFKKLFEQAVDHGAINKGVLINIRSLKSLQTGQYQDISDNHVLFRDRDLYRFISKNSIINSAIELSVSRKDLECGFKIKNIGLEIRSVPETFNEACLYLDLDKVTFPMTIRSWADGDLFQPFGMSGRQLVSDHLTNRKVPSHRKNESLIMESFDGMIAAVIFPAEKERMQPGTISEHVRVSKNTQKILKIEIIS
jgi:tRNA(Ile)-lysidine synthase